MKSGLRARSGIALVVTLLAMVVLGIVIAGVFFGSSQELRAGHNQLYHEQALAGSEHGLATVLEFWDGARGTDLALGRSLERTDYTQEGVSIQTVITRLSPATFWAVAEARAGPNGEARRATGAILRLAIPDVRPFGALALRIPPPLAGPPLIQGDVRIDGDDTAPDNWGDCLETGVPAAGVVISDSLSVGEWGAYCPPAGCIRGSPPVLVDPGVRDSGGVPLDPAAWAALASRASIRLAGGTVVGGSERPLQPYVRDGQCDTAIDHNWGDPSRRTVCGRYFPVVHVRGDLRVTSGAGQGTLLVDGDLTLAGGVTFVGAVFVRGALRTEAGGARILGITRVGGQSERASILLDGVELGFSRCAASTALGAGALPELVPRSWIEVH